jgi:DNA-binding transcriptional LysR family regulator
MDPDEHLVALHAGTVEVGLLPLPVTGPDTITVEPLFTEELCAVVPHGYRLAARQRLTVAQLAEEPLVLFPRHVAPRLYQAILGMLQEAGVTPSARYEVSHVHTCIALVAARLGVALLPASTQTAHDARLVYRRLAGPAPRLEIGMAYRRDDPSRILKDFLGSTRSAFSGARVTLLSCGGRAESRDVRTT